jgi:hypothetical protein
MIDAECSEVEIGKRDVCVIAGGLHPEINVMSNNKRGSKISKRQVYQLLNGILSFMMS